MRIGFSQARRFGIVDDVIEHWRSISTFQEWQKNLIIKSWLHNTVDLYVNYEWLLERLGEVEIR
jgi:hypothetical protein